MTSGMAPPVQHVLAAERALPAGTRLEEYEIECVLAQSSLAVLYRAYDRTLKLHVAIKEYLPDALALRSADTEVVLRDGGYAQSFERGRQAFVNEARMLAHCEHPSLQHVLRIFPHQGTMYRVMRCCIGPTLGDLRRTLGEASTAGATRSLLDSLLGALAELHQQGWVHAAISPGNILMLGDDRPMLLDSAAVQAALISDRTRRMMATLEPCYAPIEQREPSPDQPLGPWTDLYSLAVTLQFFVEGCLPEAPTDEPPRGFEPCGAQWQRLRDGQIGAPQEWSWLKALDACLAPSAQDRPQSVAQLRDLLESQGAAARRVTLAMPSQWMATCNEAIDAAGHRQLALVGAQAKDFAGMQQTLPFIAARAHEVVATSYAPALAASPRLVLPRYRRRWWAGGLVLMLLLLVVVATAGEWIGHRGGPLAADRLEFAGGKADASVQPAASSEVLAGLPHAPTGAGKPDIGAGIATFAEPAPAPSANAALADVATAAASAAPAPAQRNPRQLCGARSGYALYQCMQTQCAKRSWAQHAQCQRLRRDQSLS